MISTLFIAHVSGCTPPGPIPLFPDVLTCDGIGIIPYLIVGLINLALYIAGSLSIIFLIIGALKYTTSQGNSASLIAAKKTITYAILGLVLALLSVGIVSFISPVLTGASNNNSSILNR